jgi:hypothetical protein
MLSIQGVEEAPCSDEIDALEAFFVPSVKRFDQSSRVPCATGLLPKAPEGNRSAQLPTERVLLAR